MRTIFSLLIMQMQVNFQWRSVTGINVLIVSGT